MNRSLPVAAFWSATVLRVGPTPRASCGAAVMTHGARSAMGETCAGLVLMDGQAVSRPAPLEIPVGLNTIASQPCGATHMCACSPYPMGAIAAPGKTASAATALTGPAMRLHPLRRTLCGYANGGCATLTQLAANISRVLAKPCDARTGASTSSASSAGRSRNPLLTALTSQVLASSMRPSRAHARAA